MTPVSSTTFIDPSLRSRWLGKGQGTLAYAGKYLQTSLNIRSFYLDFVQFLWHQRILVEQQPNSTVLGPGRSTKCSPFPHRHSSSLWERVDSFIRGFACRTNEYINAHSKHEYHPFGQDLLPAVVVNERKEPSVIIL